jgi:hypothetical protein
MRRSSPIGPGRRAVAGVFLLLLATSAAPARVRAQVPEPFFPTVEQRSGLLDRFVPIEPWLPHDKFRDTFYDTRWGDRPDSHPNHPNTILAVPRIKDSGMYGRRWPGYCTESYNPYFFGSAGQSTMGPGCKPWPRHLKLVQTFLAPLRPVCYYYEQGSYVPIYDLDPVVPGPGRVPSWFPFYLKDPHGG